MIICVSVCACLAVDGVLWYCIAYGRQLKSSFVAELNNGWMGDVYSASGAFLLGV